ncbi:MAG: DivIVA domain-containing protein [Clostridia bacterium]|nr:DivIVA domain-containing protein [Clostridia bacterium]
MPNPKFAPATRGYNKQQVDKYIEEKRHEYRDTLDGMRERINALEQQLTAALKEGDRAKNKEAKIAKTLLEVTDYAEERKEEIDRLAECELERLEEFRDKWTALAKDRLELDDPVLKESLDDMATAYRKRLDETLTRELVLGRDPMYAEYAKEQARVGPAKDIPLGVEELIRKLKE